MSSNEYFKAILHNFTLGLNDRSIYGAGVSRPQTQKLRPPTPLPKKSGKNSDLPPPVKKKSGKLRLLPPPQKKTLWKTQTPSPPKKNLEKHRPPPPPTPKKQENVSLSNVGELIRSI